MKIHIFCSLITKNKNKLLQKFDCSDENNLERFPNCYIIFVMLSNFKSKFDVILPFKVCRDKIFTLKNENSLDKK